MRLLLISIFLFLFFYGDVVQSADDPDGTPSRFITNYIRKIRKQTSVHSSFTRAHIYVLYYKNVINATFRNPDDISKRKTVIDHNLKPFDRLCGLFHDNQTRFLSDGYDISFGMDCTNHYFVYLIKKQRYVIGLFIGVLMIAYSAWQSSFFSFSRIPAEYVGPNGQIQRFQPSPEGRRWLGI